MGKFVFYVASQAYYDYGRNAFPSKGVREYGDLFHKYNIPVTWLTNKEGAERGKELFTEFHENFGDEVIFWGRPFSSGTVGMRDHALSLSELEIESYIVDQQKAILDILPFARVDHVGWFYRTMPSVRVLEKLGVKSVYGHCWEMIATDGVTDNGTPWGFYYLDTEKCWKRPYQQPLQKDHGIVANEWLQHDLNKSWNYYGSCSVFSFDPNDVERAKICDGSQIDYWKAAFREYYRNREWNSYIPFVLHQEAHEQESTPGGWEVYPPETIQNTYEMTEAFLKFIKSDEFPEVEIKSLVDATEEYRKLFKFTNPTYMLYKDLPINMPIWNERKAEVWEQYQEIKKEEEEEGETLDPILDYPKFSYLNFPYGWQGMLYQDKEPFPESFVYCDTHAQLFFHRGIVQPIKIWNYLREIDEDPKNLYFNENLFDQDSIPSVSISPKNYNSLVDKVIEIELNITEPAPFGLCLWGDFTKKKWDVEFEVSCMDAINVLTVKEIGDQLLFFRIDILQPGTAKFSVYTE